MTKLIFLAAGFFIIILILGAIAVIAKFYKKVEQGKALIVNKMKAEPEVTFTGAVVFPIVHKAEVMDISVKTIEIDRRGKEGLICGDNIRADIKVTFFVRVNKTKEDVIKVAQSIGCARASDRTTLEELFNAKFSEALKTVGKQLEFVDLYTKRDEFRDQIIQVIGRDLNGYVLEDAAIDFLEQTPLSSLDEYNILDAQGIRKITELTAAEHVKTNSFENTERKLIRKQDVEADEAILELDRQKADAVAKQQREILSVQAREEAEAAKVQAEEMQRREQARLRAEEEVAVTEENKKRQVEVAEKNRERVVAVENERVHRDRILEEISRTKEAELERIAMEKALEVERKLIADVTREKIAVEKTVAEEEERIKELRVVEEARRTKTATIISAEAEAQEKLVRDIKEAEAAEIAAAHRAKERITLAEADLEASDREARAKIRLAEGIRAEEAASGLAQVEVKEADAEATEKYGMAEARVLREKGAAEGAAMQERLSGEATGLTDKAAAMKTLDEASREHEEYRIRLEKDKEVQLASIDARREVAREQAMVLAKALEEADIDIVGGDNLFVDRVLGAISMGKAGDGFVEHSDTTQQLVGDYLSGKKDLPNDLKKILSEPRLGSADVSNLTLSAFLGKMMVDSSQSKQQKLKALLEMAKELDLD